MSGRDELDCDNKLLHNNTTEPPPIVEEFECEYPSRKCDNKCINASQLCDDRQDCSDGSDEGKRCDDRLCDFSLVCSHNCHNTPEGLICSCPSGLYLQPDGTHCLEKDPCDNWGVCSQNCTAYKSRHKCTCFDGYQLMDDKFTCKSTLNATPYVIFSNRHELLGVDLHTFNVKSLISSLKNTIALDFYHTEQEDKVRVTHNKIMNFFKDVRADYFWLFFLFTEGVNFFVLFI